MTNRLEKAARHNAKAALELGRALFNGEGGRQTDPELAADWFESAAERGNVEAMAWLGYLHALGHGAEEDRDRAYTYLQRAADHGEPRAHYGLAVYALDEKADGLPEAVAHVAVAAYLTGECAPNFAQLNDWLRDDQLQDVAAHVETLLREHEERVDDGCNEARTS